MFVKYFDITPLYLEGRFFRGHAVVNSYMPKSKRQLIFRQSAPAEPLPWELVFQNLAIWDANNYH